MKLTSILLATVTAREDWQLPSEWAFCNAATLMPGVSDFYLLSKRSLSLD